MDNYTKYYELGNHNYINKNYEDAIKFYTEGINNMLSIDNIDDNHIQLLIKLYLNRSQCYIYVRDYELAINDCNTVLNYDHYSVKALLRRASANEYLGNYTHSYNDINYIITNNLVNNNKTIVNNLIRLKNILKIDHNILHNEGVPNKLVSKHQTLRLNILSSPYDNNNNINCLYYDKTYNFKLCLGNEFGLWNRDIIKDYNTSNLPKLLCHKLNFSSTIFDNNISCSMKCSDFQLNGKFDISITFSSLNHTSKLVLLKFCLDSLLPGNIDVVPVITLPMLISSSYNEEDLLSNELSFLFKLNTTIQATCIRQINISLNFSVYAIESPAYLGIAGKVWDSTYILLDYLHSNSSLINDKRVVELGCGTGVTGLGLLSLLPKQVILTDLSEVIPLVNANIKINKLLQSYSNNQYDNYNAFEYSWGSDIAVINDCDIIIASDVVYEPLYYDPLVYTLSQLLNRKISCILAHRHRHPEDHK